MAELPKFVLGRLQVAKPADHPDADLLTAFAERSLLDPERASVLTHLAVCGECRDVVSLSAQAVLSPASGERTAGAVPSRSWFRWPAVRWAAAAACAVVVVGAAVLLYPGKQKQLPMAVSDEQPAGYVSAPEPESSAAASVEKTEPSPSEATPQNGGRAAPARKAMEARNEMDTGMGPGVLTGGNTGKSGKEESSRDLDLAAKAKRTDTPDLRAQVAAEEAERGLLKDNRTQTQEAGRRVTQTATEGRDVTGVPVADKIAVPAAQAPLPAAPAQEAKSRVATANAAAAKPADEFGKASAMKETVEVTAAAPVMQVESGSLQKTDKLLFRGGRAEWSVTDGTVQRSAGSGEPMKVVPIDSKAEFLAVASIGTTVWAGGKDGVLYYSKDSGAHWTRVVPRDSTGALTGDIVSIQFDDLQHGRIVAGNEEVWATSDGGKSWKRQ